MNRNIRKKIYILITIFSIIVFNLTTYSIKASNLYKHNLVEKWSYQSKNGDYLQDVKFDKDGTIYLSNGGDYVSYIIALDFDGRLIWDYYLRGRDFNNFYVTEDYIYLISTFNQTDNLILLDKNTGRKVDEVTLDLTEDEFIKTVAVDYDGNIFVTTENSFIIFEEDGDRKWSLGIEIAFDFKPVIGPNGRVYIMEYIEDTDRHRLYSITSKGSIKWKKYLTFNGYRFTSKHSDYPIMFDEDGTIYIKDEITIYSIDYKDGDTNWKYLLEEDRTNEFYFFLEPDKEYNEGIDSNRSQFLVNKIDDNIILMSDYEIIALDADDGKEKWNFDRGIYFIKDITEVNDIVYAMFDRLYAFDEDGDIDWSYDIENQSSYFNLDLQVDNSGNLYLYEYKYNSGNGTLSLLDRNGNIRWESKELPSGRHEWYSTEIGPIHKTYNYSNGQYESELSVINAEGVRNKIKVDGAVINVIERYDYLYILTNKKLYTFKYSYVLSGTSPTGPTNEKDGSNYLKGYNLDEKWDYRIDKDDYELKVFTDMDNNTYISMFDGDYLAYIYSIDSEGDLNWKKNLTREDVSGFSISEDYIQLFDAYYKNNDYILLNKDSGKKIRSFRLNFSKADINDIIFDADENIYLSTEDELTKYNKYGSKSWDIDMEIPPSTKTVIGSDNVIYAFEYLSGNKYKLHAISNSNGKKEWSKILYFEDYSLGDKEDPILFDEDGTLYILNDDDNTLYSIDPEDGDINFKHVGNNSINILTKPDKNYLKSQSHNRSKNLANKIDNKVIVYSNNEVYALNSNNGRVDWSFKDNNYLRDIKEQNEILYVVFDDLYALNKYGDEIWDYELNSNVYYDTELIINDYGYIYVSENKSSKKDGLIHALNEYGQLQWQYKTLTNSEQNWYLTKKAPIYSAYNNYYNDTELYTINRNGSINKAAVDGKLIELIENDNYIYILTDEQLYSLKHLSGYTTTTIAKFNVNDKNSTNNPIAPNSNNRSNIKLYINGLKQDFGSNVLVIDGRTLVPVIQIFNQIGGFVKWDNISKSATINRDGDIIVLRNNSKIATINGTNVSLDTKAQIINGSFMIPLRFVGESLGAKVIWDYATQTIYIVTR